MKGKRYTTEVKIRILREADKGKAITEVCREHNMSQVTFHRWRRQFGQMDLRGAPAQGAGARERGAQEDARRVTAQEPCAGDGVREKWLAQGIARRWPQDTLLD